MQEQSPFPAIPFLRQRLDLGAIRFGAHAAKLAGEIESVPPLSPHPQMAAIREQHLSWAAEVGIATPKAVQGWAFWTLWTNCAPHIGPDRAALIADYCLAYTILDDAVEEFLVEGSLGELPRALCALEERFAGVSRTNHLERAFPGGAGLFAAWGDLGERLRAMDRQGLFARMVEGFRGYCRGVVQQAYIVRHRVPASWEGYLHNRALNVAYDPTLVCLCIVSSVEFPLELDAHPLSERLHHAHCRLGAAVNDLISFPKEAALGRASGGGQNMIAAAYEELQADDPGDEACLQRAVNEAFRFHRREFRDAVTLSERIAVDAPRYADYTKLAFMMHSSWLEWCQNAMRYRAPGASSMVVPAGSWESSEGP